MAFDPAGTAIPRAAFRTAFDAAEDICAFSMLAGVDRTMFFLPFSSTTSRLGGAGRFTFEITVTMDASSHMSVP